MLSHFYLYITSHTNNLDVILTTAKTALRKRAVTFLRIEFAKSLYHISKPQVAQEEKATTKLENSGDDQTQPSITDRHV
jgi:hypothetical protein